MSWIIQFTDLLILSACLVFLGFLGIFIARNNLIIVLLSIEIILLVINFLFILFSVYLDDILGQVVAVLILSVAAAETSIGLALLVLFYRLNKVIYLDLLNHLKG